MSDQPVEEVRPDYQGDGYDPEPLLTAEYDMKLRPNRCVCRVDAAHTQERGLGPNRFRAQPVSVLFVSSLFPRDYPSLLSEHPKT